MSLISNSFKKNAATRFAKSMNVEDENTIALITEAYQRGFDMAESMFTEQ